MNSRDVRKVAFYKVRPINHQMPIRPGPNQCIRNCSRCILGEKTTNGLDEDIINLMSFDNFVLRKPFQPFHYQSIQYHIGQIEILRANLKRDTSAKTIFLLASDTSSDLKFLNNILSYSNLPTASKIEQYQSKFEDTLQKHNVVAVPIEYKNCASSPSSFLKIFDSPENCVPELRILLEPLVERAKEGQSFDINIVPVVITKDHDSILFLGSGSVCVQILEPFSLNYYINRLTTSSPLEHLVQHLYYDLARNAGMLPPHLVAFLILYLVREEGVLFNDLVEYVEFFRKQSMFLDMHFAFTGPANFVVQYGLKVLGRFINHSKQVYSVKDESALMDYANVVTPLIAYYGIIGRAILMEHNRDSSKEPQIVLTAGMRVLKDNVLKIAVDLVELLQDRIPFRRPCLGLDVCVDEIFNQMHTFRPYFKIEEPKIMHWKARAWAGESDDDEEYFLENQDNPAFKPWIVLTHRENRLDQLNLFTNAVSAWLD